jgi:hypothetical protein
MEARARAHHNDETVSRETCNIHIDETGFDMTGPTGDIVVSPDFLRHTLVELLWKTKLKARFRYGLSTRSRL